MSNFVGTPPFSNLIWVAMEAMHFLMAQTGIFLDNFDLHSGGPNKKNGTYEKLSKSAR